MWFYTAIPSHGLLSVSGTAHSVSLVGYYVGFLRVFMRGNSYPIRASIVHGLYSVQHGFSAYQGIESHNKELPQGISYLAVRLMKLTAAHGA